MSTQNLPFSIISINHKKNITNKTIKSKHTREKSSSHQCSLCSYSHTNKTALQKHYGIHTKPVVCTFAGCGKVFSPSHSHQYKQHMTAHNGGLNIKCKFCEIIFRTTNSHTLHMKSKHKKEYYLYMKKVNKYNTDCNVLQPQQIIKLTNECLYKYNKYDKNKKMNLDTDYNDYKNYDDYDEELSMIEDNKNDKYNYYGLNLLADIALGY